MSFQGTYQYSELCSCDSELCSCDSELCSCDSELCSCDSELYGDYGIGSSNLNTWHKEASYYWGGGGVQLH